jgi:hypothetical protein
MTSDCADEFDLRGKVPESWCCVDCGVNTAPGLPNRAGLENNYRMVAAINKLSGEERPVASMEFDDRCEVYSATQRGGRRA